MSIEWNIKSWEELSKEELYNLLQLRIEVFVIEQNCPYQECDGQDPKSIQILGKLEGNVEATARLIPHGVEVKIGRIVVRKKHRGKGWGKIMIEKCIDFARSNYPDKTISMSAQVYLIEYYQSLGFETEGETYLEDDIPHIRMTLGSHL
jgi:ElaA protein